METQRRRWRWVLYILGAAAAFWLGAAGLAMYGYYHREIIEDRARQVVVEELTRRFQSPVSLRSLHVKLWPRVEVTGGNLVLQNHGRTDVPPIIQVEQFTFHLGAIGVFRAPSHIGKVTVRNMVITVPPRGKSAGPSPLAQFFPQGKSPVVIDELVCDNTELLILAKNPEKEPLDFDIHNLTLENLIFDKPFKFWGTLTNAKPVGEIATRGQLGPWDADEPRNTPVSGSYEFVNADLDPFPGIGGTLSSTGKYDGQLDHLEVSGRTNTPNFSLDPVGRPVPLRTEFSATVDGTNGDTYLHPVRATLGRSLIVANGSVVRAVNKQGHLISLDVVATDAHLEDILGLATKTEKPVLTGVTNVKAKLVIPPGKQKVLDKMQLNGDFSVAQGSFSSPAVRDKLQALSRRALGEVKDETAGSALSDMAGHFILDKSVITFKPLMFSVEGAKLVLDGNYTIRGETLDFNGQLMLHAKLSHLTTGIKSLLLKPVDPFYAKKGMGAVIPISVTGTRNAPTIGLTVMHKTIKKQMTAKQGK
jgi:AsmA-like C-terminal region